MSYKYRFDDNAIVYEIIANEIVLVNLASGFYFILDDIASEIWLALKAGSTADDLVRSLSETYTAPIETIQPEVDEFIAELVRENIFQIETDSAPGGSTASSETRKRALTPRAWHKPGMFKYTDMSYLIQMDPIWDYDETGWPKRRTNPSANKK